MKQGILSKIKKKLALELGWVPKDFAVTADGLIAYYDWGQKNNAELEWFTEFVRHRMPEQRQRLNFYGVYGKGKFVRRRADGVKVFFSLENVDKKYMKWNFLFGDYALPYVDLAMGFADLQNDKYLRFPLWLQYIFSPTADRNEIEATVKQINEVHYPKTKECALVAGHDKHGTRTMIYDGVKDLLHIECAGRWKNNTNDLWDRYENQKIPYLKQFKFNICPENINTPNYVTEKLFEAFAADAIPIYYGSDNLPEPGIINSDAVVFWNKTGDNKKAKDIILQLKTNDDFYHDFMKQPKLLPGAVEYVCDRYTQLEKKLQFLDKKQ